MKTLKLVRISVLSLGLTSLLSGCIFVAGNTASDWSASHNITAEKISLLDLGQSRDSVVEKLGSPEKSEAFTINNSEIYVLYYSTTDSDDKDGEKITTPLVFKSGKLLGWGQEVLDDYRQ
ncbi:hypothetical protein MAH1_06260 [Sessilibacter sp. MAH1]